MLKDFCMLKTVEGNMWFTESHVFVVSSPLCSFDVGLPPKKVSAFIDDIRECYGGYGECWIIPVRLGDKDDWLHFRCMQPRTVWFAIISGHQDSDGLRRSLGKLKAWVKDSQLPLKIAIDHELLYTKKTVYRGENKSYWLGGFGDQLCRIFAEEIGDLDVTIYKVGRNKSMF